MSFTSGFSVLSIHKQCPGIYDRNAEVLSRFTTSNVIFLKSVPLIIKVTLNHKATLIPSSKVSSTAKWE